MAKKKTDSAKAFLALLIAGASSVGLAYALKKKEEEFKVEIQEVFEYI